MPNLSIKNVPESLLTKLRDRAAQHHRSLQGELMALLSEAVDSARNAPAPLAPDRPLAARRSGTRRIEEIAAEHKGRWKRPFNEAPRAVDVIRADRDAR